MKSATLGGTSKSGLPDSEVLVLFQKFTIWSLDASAASTPASGDEDIVRYDSDVREKVEEELKEPDMWDVVLHNDDYTTKAFVVEVLRTVFHKSGIEATKLMLQVHRHGRGVVGTYTYDIAHTKVTRVHDMAKKREFPLRCSVEKST